MKNKLFALLPILLVGLVGCGNKGSSGNGKVKATEIDFLKFHELAEKADQKSNPNSYAKAYGYVYRDDEEHFDFALDDWFVLSEGNVNYSEELSPAYRSDAIADFATMIAVEVEDDDLCSYYKLSNGGLRYQFDFVDGIEAYEFDKYGRIAKIYTEYHEEESERDSRFLVFHLEDYIDLTFTWTKTLPRERDCFYIALDSHWGLFNDYSYVRILKFPKNTQETFINVLQANIPFYLGSRVTGWNTRPVSIHDDYQLIRQSLAYDVIYEENPEYGVFTFEESAKEITVELTVTEGAPWVQLSYGGAFYQEEVKLNGETKVTKKVTLKVLDNYQEPRAIRRGRTLFVYGDIHSIGFADQSGLFNKNNAKLYAAEYNRDLSGTLPSYGFNGCNQLQYLHLPDEGIHYIAPFAFYHCGNSTFQIYLNKNLGISENAFCGCEASIVYELDKVPLDPDEPGYDAWRTFPSYWDTNFLNGFTGHQSYRVWTDFVCKMSSGYEVMFCFYWEETIGSIKIASHDSLYNTEVTIYDESFNVMQTPITRESGSELTATVTLEANNYYYIGMKNFGTSAYNIDVTFIPVA